MCSARVGLADWTQGKLQQTCGLGCRFTATADQAQLEESAQASSACLVPARRNARGSPRLSPPLEALRASGPRSAREERSHSLATMGCGLSKGSLGCASVAPAPEDAPVGQPASERAAGKPGKPARRRGSVSATARAAGRATEARMPACCLPYAIPPSTPCTTVPAGIGGAFGRQPLAGAARPAVGRQAVRQPGAHPSRHRQPAAVQGCAWAQALPSAVLPEEWMEAG